MNTLSEIKSKLDNIYNTLDNIEKFGIDVSDYKDQIDSYDLELEKYDSNSNIATQIKLSKSQKKECEILYKSVILLEKYIIGINKSLELITYLNELDLEKSITKEDEETATKELNNIVSHILDYLLTVNQFKNVLNLNLFDPIIEKLYQIIKYEYKYTGKSLIFNYMYPNFNLTNKFFDVWENDCKKNNELLKNVNDYGNIYEYKYYLNGTMKTIALNEDGFLQEKEEELSKLVDKYNICTNNIEETDTKYKEKKETNRRRKQLKTRLYSRFLPVLLSLGVLIGANFGVNKIIKNSSKYKTTKEYYSTLTDETITEEEYSRLSVGDTKITVYYPTDEKNARIIKQYDLNEPSIDIENWAELNYDSFDFSSSTYKVDNEANEKSTNQFIEVERVIDTNTDEKNPSIVLMLLASIGVTLSTLLLDYQASKIINSDGVLLTSLLDIPKVKRLYNIEKTTINHDYPKQNTKIIRNKLDEYKKLLKEVKKEYQELYSDYDYMSEYLENDGYKKELK